MLYLGKAIGTAAVFFGTAGLAYMFHDFNLLNSTGAGWMTFGCFVLSAGIWKL